MLLALAFGLFMLSVYGLSNAVAVLKIGQFFFGQGHCEDVGCKSARHPYDKRKFLGRIPKLGDLFYCPPCLAFWIGMAFSAWVLSPAWLLMSALAPDRAVFWKAVVMDGLAASAVTWLLHALAMRLIDGLKNL
jgi:hypothetical protein